MHQSDIYEFIEVTVLSDSEIWKFWKNNQILEKMIDTPEQRKRRKIINNAKFLKESNHEEKTALFWIGLVNMMSSTNVLKKFLENKELFRKIRKVYPLNKTYLDDFESSALFNKFGVFEQDTIQNISFHKKNEKWNGIKACIKIEDIYNEFPEIKKIYNSNQEIGIRFTSLMPGVINLSIAWNCLWKDLFPFDDLEYK